MWLLEIFENLIYFFPNYLKKDCSFTISWLLEIFENFTGNEQVNENLFKTVSGISNYDNYFEGWQCMDTSDLKPDHNYSNFLLHYLKLKQYYPGRDCNSIGQHSFFLLLSPSSSYQKNLGNIFSNLSV